MHKILLLCSSGITASLFTSQLENKVANQLNNCVLIPCPISEVSMYSSDVVMLLLTPQVRFNYTKIKGMFPDKLVLKVSHDDYEQININNIFNIIVTYLMEGGII